ncbi:hypothetical protein B0T25DRAFT_533914, partial [Lasiosphaeria hispida]
MANHVLLCALCPALFLFLALVSAARILRPGNGLVLPTAAHRVHRGHICRWVAVGLDDWRPASRPWQALATPVENRGIAKIASGSTSIRHTPRRPGQPHGVRALSATGPFAQAPLLQLLAHTHTHTHTHTQV